MQQWRPKSRFEPHVLPEQDGDTAMQAKTRASIHSITRRRARVGFSLLGIVGCLLILESSRAQRKPDLIRLPPARPGIAVIHARLVQDDGRTVHWQWTIVGARNWDLHDPDSFGASNPHVLRLAQRARTPAEDALTWSQADSRPNEKRPHVCVYDWQIVPVKGMGDNVAAWSIETDVRGVYGSKGPLTFTDSRMMENRHATPNQLLLAGDKDDLPFPPKILLKKDLTVKLPATVTLATVGKQTYTLALER
jgi:hypothetical protein